MATKPDAIQYGSIADQRLQMGRPFLNELLDTFVTLSQFLVDRKKQQARNGVV